MLQMGVDGSLPLTKAKTPPSYIAKGSSGVEVGPGVTAGAWVCSVVGLGVAADAGVGVAICAGAEDAGGSVAAAPGDGVAVAAGAGGSVGVGAVICAGAEGAARGPQAERRASSEMATTKNSQMRLTSAVTGSCSLCPSILVTLSCCPCRV